RGRRPPVPQSFEAFRRDFRRFENRRLLDHRAGAVSLTAEDLTVNLVDVAAVVAFQAGIDRKKRRTVLAEVFEILSAAVWKKEVPLIIDECPELPREGTAV